MLNDWEICSVLSGGPQGDRKLLKIVFWQDVTSAGLKPYTNSTTTHENRLAFCPQSVLPTQKNPVIYVTSPDTGELVYALRIKDSTFQSMLCTAGEKKELYSLATSLCLPYSVR